MDDGSKHYGQCGTCKARFLHCFHPGLKKQNICNKCDREARNPPKPPTYKNLHP